MTLDAPHSRRRPAPPPRDQQLSAFTRILRRLIASTAGARGAALVDSEGETVDFAGTLDTFDLKVTAAHFQIVMREARSQPHFETIFQLVVMAKERSYVVRAIHPSYSIVFVLHERAAFCCSARALHEAHLRLCMEASLPLPPRQVHWFGAEIREDRSHRPLAALRDEQWREVIVLGGLVGLGARERGFRVRLPNGAEFNLVRERHGRWFSDEPIG